MTVKILCAGCSKDERERAEAQVHDALGRSAGAGAWTVSLVKLGGRWSVTLDSPPQGIRARTFVAPGDGLVASIREALRPAPAPAVVPAAAAPTPAAAPAPAPAAAAGGIVPKPTPAAGPAAGPRQAAAGPAAPRPGPPTSSAAPTSVAPASAASRGAVGSGQAIGCEHCRKPFAILYEGGMEGMEETVPAACPHCWQMNQVRLPADVALTQEYRTEKR